MRYLLIILLFASCTTTKKALNKISEGDFTPQERKHLATICAAEFPNVSEETTTVTYDSSGHEERIEHLEQALEFAAEDFDQVVQLAGVKEEEINRIKQTYQKRLDSISSVLNHIKKHPVVVERTVTKEKIVTNTAEVERLNILNTELQKQNAALAVEYEAQKTELKICNEKPDLKWKYALWAFIAGVVASGVIGIILKLKRFI